jgi:hypothetical protein
MYPQMPAIKKVIKILDGASPVKIRQQLAARGTTVARMWSVVVLGCEARSVLKVLRKKGWSLEQLAMVSRDSVQAWRATEMAKYPSAIPGAAYHSAETAVNALLPAVIAAASNQ